MNVKRNTCPVKTLENSRPEFNLNVKKVIRKYIVLTEVLCNLSVKGLKLFPEKEHLTNDIIPQDPT